jgi:transcriptional regulator with XRE-family HTH domain
MTAFDGLGKALRWIRDKQTKKQYQVADAAGVTKAMLSAYETGKQKPSIETLEKILGALQVDLADLFNALQVVNERPPLVRVHDRYAASSPRLGGGAPAIPGPDVYEVLGIERPLPPVEEEALADMLGGFHKLLRYFHAHLSAGALHPTPPAAAPEE